MSKPSPDARTDTSGVSGRVTLCYTNKRGAGVVEKIDADQLPKRLASLSRRGIDATAHDNGGPCGWSWMNEGRRAWCCDEDAGRL